MSEVNEVVKIAMPQGDGADESARECVSEKYSKVVGTYIWRIGFIVQTGRRGCPRNASIRNAHGFG